MKIIEFDLHHASEIRAGMILHYADKSPPRLVLRVGQTGELVFINNRWEGLDNHWQNKFWMVPLAEPFAIPTLLCVDLIFDKKTLTVYRVEP